MISKEVKTVVTITKPEDLYCLREVCIIAAHALNRDKRFYVEKKEMIDKFLKDILDGLVDIKTIPELMAIICLKEED